MNEVGRARSALAAVFVLIAAVVTLSAHVRHYSLKADDDRIWLYYTAAELGRVPARTALEGRLTGSLRADGASSDNLVHVELRRDYSGNYLLATLLYRAAAEFLRWFGRPDVNSDYPGFLAEAMFLGFAAAFVLATAGMLGGVLATRNPTMWAAVGVALTLLAVVDFLGGFQGSYQLLSKSYERSGEGPLLKETLRNAVGLLINPTPAFSPFGDTPRNHFILLGLAVFALRWSERFAGAYALVLVLGLVHRSYSGMLLGFLVVTDLWLRPQVLRQRYVWLIVTLAFVSFVGGETVGTVIGVTRWQVLVGSGMVAGIGVALAASRHGWIGTGRARLAVARVRRTLLARGPILADVVSIGLLWTLTLPVAAVINERVTVEQSIYFWGQIHGRALAMLRPAVYLGIVLMAVAALTESFKGSRRWAWGGTLALCLAVSIPMAHRAAAAAIDPVSRLRAGLASLDRRLTDGPPDVRLIRGEEAIVYYAFVKTLDTGVDWTQRLAF